MLSNQLYWGECNELTFKGCALHRCWLPYIEITNIHYCHWLWLPDILPAFLDSSLGTKGPGGPGNLRLAVRVQMALVSGTLLGEGGREGCTELIELKKTAVKVRRPRNRMPVHSSHLSV